MTNGETVVSVSCPSTTLCVGGDNNGNIWTSTNPGNGASSTWSQLAVESNTVIAGVSCPSTTLCVAIDSMGKVLTATTDPTQLGNWSVSASAVDASGQPDALSCHTTMSTTLCALGDDLGNLFTSTSPTNSASWHSVRPDPGQAIKSVACPSTKMCLAADEGIGTNIVTSTNADGATPTWHVQAGIGGGLIESVSCPSASQCVAGGSNSNVLNTSDPSDGANATPNAIWTSDTISNGDGGPPTLASLQTPVSAVPTADGGFLITQFGQPDLSSPAGPGAAPCAS